MDDARTFSKKITHLPKEMSDNTHDRWSGSDSYVHIIIYASFKDLY